MKPSPNQNHENPRVRTSEFGPAWQALAKVLFGVVFFHFILMRFEVVSAFFTRVISVSTPFIAGGFLAFILNIPLGFLERRVLFKLKETKLKGLIRPLSMVLSLLFFTAVISLVAGLIIPTLVETISMLANQVPGLIRSFDAWLSSVEQPQTQEIIDKIQDMVLQIDFQNLANSILQFLSKGSNMAGIGGLISGAFGTVINTFVALVFSIYLLANKETLGRQARKILFAYLPEAKADYINHVASVTFRNFHGFFTGQFTEAIIVGILSFIGMSLLRLPYAAMLSVLAAFMNLIPIAGAWIGTAIGALMIAAINPVQALIYIIFTLLLQQFESNLIYPRVMGSAVDLPSMWVLVAITVGGSLMGLAGMILFVPLFAVIYTLMGESANKRLDQRGIDIQDKIQAEREGD